jgi:hypothetical protein
VPICYQESFIFIVGGGGWGGVNGSVFGKLKFGKQI